MPPPLSSGQNIIKQIVWSGYIHMMNFENFTKQYFHPIDIFYLEFVHCRNVTSPQWQSRMFMIQDLCGTAINVPRVSRKWLVIKIPLYSHCWYWSCQKFYTIYFCEITVEIACSWIMNNMTIINYLVIKAMEWHSAFILYFLTRKKDWLSKIYIR